MNQIIAWSDKCGKKWALDALFKLLILSDLLCHSGRKMEQHLDASKQRLACPIFCLLWTKTCFITFTQRSKECQAFASVNMAKQKRKLWLVGVHRVVTARIYDYDFRIWHSDPLEKCSLTWQILPLFIMMNYCEFVNFIEKTNVPTAACLLTPILDS